MLLPLVLGCVPFAAPPTVSPVGEIIGRVTDSGSGTPLSAANISTNPPTSAVITDAEGHYVIRNIPPGTYTVTAATSDHMSMVVDVAVVAGQTTTADLSLSPQVTSTPTVDFVLQFDGDNDCVELGQWHHLSVFTISFRAKPAELQKMEWANIMDNNHTDSRAWVVQQDGAQNNRYTWGSGSVISFDLLPGVWHHVVLVRNTTDSSLYLDGALAGQVSDLPVVNYDGTEFFRLGCWGGGGRYWAGQLDEVQVWDRAFSLEQIADLTEQEEGLVAHYNFNEGTGQTVHDSSINGYDGLLINSPTWAVSDRSP